MQPDGIRVASEFIEEDRHENNGCHNTVAQDQGPRPVALWHLDWRVTVPYRAYHNAQNKCCDGKRDKAPEYQGRDRVDKRGTAAQCWRYLDRDPPQREAQSIDPNPHFPWREQKNGPNENACDEK